MTREEAIDCLEGLKIYLKTEHIDQEAIDMAIETLQAEPVKHGEWEKNEPLPSEWQYKCSKCGVPSKSNSHNFCPNCGAKMDKEIEDNGTE